MALLIRQGAGAGRWAFLGVTALLAFSLGCAFLVRDEVLGPGFSHSAHVEELDCSDCHLGVDSSDDPGLPVIAQCQLCHDEESEALTPEEQRIDRLFVDGKPIGAGVSRLDDEIVFSHLQHVESSYSCADCHTGIEESSHPATLGPITMADCMDCHEQDGVANECSTCHSEIGDDWQPPSHQQNWLRYHGATVRSGSDTIANRCDLCHSQSSCDECHFQEAPEGHTNFWRIRGHGVAARMDRSSCATCHRSDVCQQCHQETAPLNHRGAWGGVMNNHCINCHTPLRTQGCATCHQATPGHDLASPLPADHSPSRDCRICHGVDAPLPHADNGGLCITCHN